jgi:hypothetical protein
VLLSLAFSLAFLVPLSVALSVGGLLSIPWMASNVDGPQELFSNPFSIASQGSYVEISSGDLPEGGPSRVRAPVPGNPIAQERFLVTAWFKLRRLPAPGEQLILFSKYEGSPLPSNGYALALRQDELALRPLVFWGDASTPGRWYDFPAVELSSKDWFAFAMSFSDDRYLGLHLITTHDQGNQVRLLGGYELSTAVVPSSTAPLILGAPRDRPFRGLIGPVGVFTGPGLIDTRKIINEIAKVPYQVPAGIRSTALPLIWVPEAVTKESSSTERASYVVTYHEAGGGRGAKRRHALNSALPSDAAGDAVDS